LTRKSIQDAVVNLREPMKFLQRIKLLLRFLSMVYFSAAKTITIVLILLSFPGLYRDQLQYRE
jgi:hypothetical protein